MTESCTSMRSMMPYDGSWKATRMTETRPCLRWYKMYLFDSLPFEMVKAVWLCDKQDMVSMTTYVLQW